MILKFQGRVEMGDSCRVSDEDENGSVRIGDVDFVDKVGETTFRSPVTVAIADERFAGDLELEYGWGYSEYTPMEADKLQVGEHDILQILERYEGKEITVWVADEPINTLADPPAPQGKGGA